MSLLSFILIAIGYAALIAKAGPIGLLLIMLHVAIMVGVLGTRASCR